LAKEKTPKELADEIIALAAKGFEYIQSKTVKHLGDGTFEGKPWEVRVASIKAEGSYAYRVMVDCPREVGILLSHRAKGKNMRIQEVGIGNYYLITPKA
jgi:hypothetical protein